MSRVARFDRTVKWAVSVLICLTAMTGCVVDGCFGGFFNAPPPTGSTTPKPVLSSCGHTNTYYYANTPGTGIVGGKVADYGQFPWIARLKIGTATCGAAIIGDSWLLTAAHCVYGYVSATSSVTAYFGDWDVNSIDKDEISMTIAKIILHDNYDSTNEASEYDFALLQLPSALDFTKTWSIQKICLPSSCSDGCAAGSMAQIAGWGTTSETKSVAERYMNAANLPIVDSAICKQNYLGTATVTDAMICAGYSAGGIDSCQGDSGGPLMINDQGYYKLCGVTSFGKGCARANYPGVYARVCSVLPWITTKTTITSVVG